MIPVPASISNVAQVSISIYDTCVVTTSGAVECIGFNGDGELGIGLDDHYGAVPHTTWQTTISSGAIDVACGDGQACALMASGEMYCWGANGFGGDSPTLVSGFY